MEIAADPRCRPALRWRAARDLATFGESGRKRAVPELQAMSTDASMPVIIRMDALRVLAQHRPDLRAEVLQSLRNLCNVAKKPLALLQIFELIGLYDAAEGAQQLHDMAQNRTLPSGVRLRAAAAMVELRSDYRERAAIVAREVMHDATVAWHIKLKAAKALARWSEMCRDEALAVLATLTS